IPTGSFYIGGPSGTNRYLHDPNDVNAGILIQSEAAIPASSFTVTGTLSYDDDIPASYPKGYNSFYCMKYKISQRQYVEFLNTLNTTQQNERVESVLSQSIINRFVMCDNFAPQGRNGIYFVGTSDEGNYLFGCDLNNNGVINQVDDGQEISCNYLNREDYLAYLDWSALRVPTRLEIWKICRGPEMVIDSEMAWGSNIVNEININDVTNLDTSSEMLPTPVNGPMYEDAPLRTGIFANSSSNRFNSGATYYGVMDMTIGMLEYCTGLRGDDLNYIGNLGDGELTVIGESNEIDFLLSQIYGQSNINVLDGVLVVSRADFTTGGRGVR
ncbi:MAG: hypothetical protein HKN68_13935, partial [Saprospiraceae bacterium]|nr:hypothetical protein [Saprospiraceae bacterium]